MRLLSSERAFEDFTRRLTPLRVRLEAPHRDARTILEVEYQAESDRLEHALRSGTYLALRLALASCPGFERTTRKAVR